MPRRRGTLSLGSMDDEAQQESASVREASFPFLPALRAAVRWLAGLDESASADLAHGTLFFPALGLLFGLLVAAIERGAGAFLPAVLVAPLVVGALALLQGGGGPRAVLLGIAALVSGDAGKTPDEGPVDGGLVAEAGLSDVDADADARGVPGAGALAAGSLATALLLVAKALAVAALAGRALGIAVVLAVLLGRWALVVQAYGSIPRPGDRFAATLCRGCTFREFGNASVSAMAMTLALANAVGLGLLFAVAAQTIGLRILAHRRGGASRVSIEAGGELAETTVLVLCALLARALAAG